MTGLQAAQTQFDQIVTSRLPYIIAVVIAVAFLLIMTAFLSLPLAVKAAVLNLFSIAAAYGVVVAVFQFGWGRSLLGISQNVPVEAYVPMIMFAIAFGLSMDYEVFLLSGSRKPGTAPATITTPWPPACPAPAASSPAPPSS